MNKPLVRFTLTYLLHTSILIKKQWYVDVHVLASPQPDVFCESRKPRMVSDAIVINVLAISNLIVKSLLICFIPHSKERNHWDS